jgi:hypothetical protein
MVHSTLGRGLITTGCNGMPREDGEAARSHASVRISHCLRISDEAAHVGGAPLEIEHEVNDALAGLVMGELHLISQKW